MPGVRTNRRFAGVAVGLAMLAALGPGGASASHCAEPLFVHSYIQDVISVPVYLGCLIDQGHEVDYRLLNPGATTLRIQYIVDYGVPQLTAVLNGLGYEDRAVTLQREPTTGGYHYLSPFIPYEAAVTDAGCLNVRIPFGVDHNGRELFVETNYHTATASCPDFP